MTVTEIAHDLVAMCREGKFAESGEKYWADDVVSIEAMGEPAEVRGKDSVRGKGEWWSNAHEIHDTQVEGPYVNGDSFVVLFKMDITVKQTGVRQAMDEVGLYTIKDGKIVEERFFYAM
jgi:ketosteroid isomerase-like protein